MNFHYISLFRAYIFTLWHDFSLQYKFDDSIYTVVWIFTTVPFFGAIPINGGTNLCCDVSTYSTKTTVAQVLL